MLKKLMTFIAASTLETPRENEVLYAPRPETPHSIRVFDQHGEELECEDIPEAGDVHIKVPYLGKEEKTFTVYIEDGKKPDVWGHYPVVSNK